VNRQVTTLCAALLLAGATGAAQAECIADFSGGAQSTPTSRFDDNGDGTVTDTDTGLMWMKCAAGKAGSDCSYSIDYTDYTAISPVADIGARLLTWSDALAYARRINMDAEHRDDRDINPGGHADWRLPDAKELSSIIERCTFNPSLNTEVFTENTPTSANSGKYWSATPAYQKEANQVAAELPLSVVVFDFHSGNDWREVKTETLYLRLVRNAN